MIRPRPGYVLVMLPPHNPVSEGGIITTAVIPPVPTIGIVVAIGERVHDVAKGDRVTFGPESGEVVEGFGYDLLMIAEAHILAVIEKEAAA